MLLTLNMDLWLEDVERLYLEGLHLPNWGDHDMSFGLYSTGHSLQVCSVVSPLTITTPISMVPQIHENS